MESPLGPVLASVLMTELKSTIFKKLFDQSLAKLSEIYWPQIAFSEKKGH